MKNQMIILVISLLSISPVLSQWQVTSKDSMNIFTDSVFSILEKKNLYREKIDWSSYKKEFKTKSLTKSSFAEYLELYGQLWLDLGDRHSFIEFNDFRVSNPTVGRFDGSEFSAALLERYQQGAIEFECKVLDNQYGYILMPGIDALEEKEVTDLAQEMYDEIYKIARNNDLKGWILDLRFNTGGNCWPMIGGLYELLGDGVFGGWKYENNMQQLELANGKAIEDGTTILAVQRNKNVQLDKDKVAVITGVLTGSSGEIVAAAFKGRDHTISIGEKSIGLTTTNNTYYMPYGAYFNNSEAYNLDRIGQIYEYIIPDVEIIKGDDFKNVFQDKNIQSAIQFFNAKP